jgi:MarR family transcriptional regulator, lower aerobic nicotinate degradation pathway regulator
MSAVHGMPGHLIRRLQQISVARFTEECGEFSLTSVQFAALTAIGENPGLDATRLSAIIAFDRSTIGDVLERLEGKGWIARAPSRTDKRAKTLKLTPAGRRVLDAVLPAVHRVQERLLAPLAEADRARFMTLLAQLVDLHGSQAGVLDDAE